MAQVNRNGIELLPVLYYLIFRQRGSKSLLIWVSPSRILGTYLIPLPLAKLLLNSCVVKLMIVITHTHTYKTAKFDGLFITHPYIHHAKYQFNKPALSGFQIRPLNTEAPTRHFSPLGALLAQRYLNSFSISGASNGER